MYLAISYRVRWLSTQDTKIKSPYSLSESWEGFRCCRRLWSSCRVNHPGRRDTAPGKNLLKLCWAREDLATNGPPYHWRSWLASVRTSASINAT